MKAYLFAAVLAIGIAIPVAVPALADTPATSTAATSDTTVTLYNPLGEEDIRLILGRIIKGILSIVGSLALLMFIYGGVLWLTSAGNPEMVKKGKEILIWTTLGIGIIFASYAIVSAILYAITEGTVSPST